MKNAYLVIQQDSSYRASPFGYVSSQRVKQGFKITPFDVGAHRVFDDRFERLGLFLVQGSISYVSKTPRSFQEPHSHHAFVHLNKFIHPTSSGRSMQPMILRSDTIGQPLIRRSICLGQAEVRQMPVTDLR